MRLVSPYIRATTDVAFGESTDASETRAYAETMSVLQNDTTARGDQNFGQLQAKLRSLWPALTARTVEDGQRTLIVVPSFTMSLPAHLGPIMPSYEERFLFLVLILLRQPGTRVVYVTSQPILPRLLDYYFSLVPHLSTPDARQRVFLVSLSDSTFRPLTEKLLCRPRVLQRLRRLALDQNAALIWPFMVTPLEVELSVQLGMPLYGPDPALAGWGTKSGARRLFEAERVPHPVGVEDVRAVDEVVTAIERIQETRPGVPEVVVKLNQGAGGLGNGIVDVSDANTRASREERVRRMRLEDEDGSLDDFFLALADQGGVVEERIVAAEVRSPSVQLRCGPGGEYEVLSTHDQLLGGVHGQIYLGCRFPAQRDYAGLLTHEALKIGARLAREGVVGRYSVDFVVARDTPGGWHPSAIEINLRNGGTTHPQLTLQALTDGTYDADAMEFRSSTGHAKYYVATDHLEAPEYASLTPDDLLDMIPSHGLTWDGVREVGVAFHMMSGLAVAGRVGVTAIGDNETEADEHFQRATSVLDHASGRTR